jgi:hypothetical protein
MKDFASNPETLSLFFDREKSSNGLTCFSFDPAKLRRQLNPLEGVGGDQTVEPISDGEAMRDLRIISHAAGAAILDKAIKTVNKETASKRV